MNKPIVVKIFKYDWQYYNQSSPACRNVNDSTVAEEMLSSFNLKDKYIYADKGYDTASIVRYIENQGGNAVIQANATL